jgi:hypothetical protein
MVTADAGYYSQALENAVLEKGVKRVAVPNRNTRSVERKKKEHRWLSTFTNWRIFDALVNPSRTTPRRLRAGDDAPEGYRKDRVLGCVAEISDALKRSDQQRWSAMCVINARWALSHSAFADVTACRSAPDIGIVEFRASLACASKILSCTRELT